MILKKNIRSSCFLFQVWLIIIQPKINIPMLFHKRFLIFFSMGFVACHKSNENEIDQNYDINKCTARRLGIH